MQHAPVEKTTRTRPIALDIDGEPRGVLVVMPEGFRFLAVRFDAFGVDGHVFPSLEAAEEAVRAAVRANP